jgi:hypothetical protein
MGSRSAETLVSVWDLVSGADPVEVLEGHPTVEGRDPGRGPEE